GAVALHIAVPAHRTSSSTRSPQIAAQHQEVHDLLDIRDRVAVLREPHSPATDETFRAHRDLGSRANLGTLQPALLTDIGPGHLSEGRAEFLKAAGVLVDELMIKHQAGTTLLLFEHLLHHALEE